MTVVGHICVRCADNKQPLGLVWPQYTTNDEISNSNITQRGTQASGLGVMIAWCSLDSQHRRIDRHPGNVGCSLFRYTNGDLRNHVNQRPKRKAWTREDNQLALHSYFRSNPTRRGYRKRMMKILQELSNFQTTSQRLADQVRTIIKKGWFSDLEIIEIHQKINDQQCSNNTLPGTSNINKQKQLIRKELPTSENGNSTQPNNPEQTLSQGQKLNLENLKRIMSSEKTTLPSLRNIEWRIVKAEIN